MSDHTFNAYAKQLLEFAQQMTLSASISWVSLVYKMQVKCIPLDMISHNIYNTVKRQMLCEASEVHRQDQHYAG